MDEKNVRLEMARGKTSNAASRRRRRYSGSGRSNEETTTDSATSDDVVKTEPKPCDVDDVKVEVPAEEA